MKLLSFETQTKSIANNKFGALSIDFFDNNTLIYKHYKEDLVDLKNSNYSFIINHLTVGDSCKFIVPTKRIASIVHPFVLNTSTEYLTVLVKFDATYNEEKDAEMVEQAILKTYLSKVKAKPIDGVYIKNINVGTGKKVEQGDEITIVYKGSFVNGLAFDNIFEKNKFTFTYGTQGQVLKGLGIAIKSMREGQKSKIIIPSLFAFGEEGSSTLIVAPYTTVVYDLEIIKVN